MPTKMYLFVDFIRGMYWILWIAVDVFFIFQIYYEYPVLYIGIIVFVAVVISTYFEYKLYLRLLNELEKKL